MIEIKNEYQNHYLKIIIAAAFISILFLSCSREKIKLSTEFVEFNTTIKFTVYQLDPSAKVLTESLLCKAGDLLDNINQQLDPDLAGSEVEKINRYAYLNKTAVSPSLASLLNKSFQISALTDSAFDVAVYPLFDQWGFTIGKTPAKPDSLLLSTLASLVSTHNIEFADDSIRLLTPQVKIGFGAIAKGWAADSIACYFRSQGLKNFIVAAAGDIVVNSPTPKTIAVKHPRNEKIFLDTLYIDYGAISTSGDYERFFVQDGIHYCHLINPKTGYPDSDCLSVTIITDAGWKSDALATGVFVMGKTRGIKFLQKHNISGIISFLNDSNEVERIEVNIEKYKKKIAL